MAFCPGPKHASRIPLRVSVLPCGSDYGLRGKNIPPKKGILVFAGAFSGK